MESMERRCSFTVCWVIRTRDRQRAPGKQAGRRPAPIWARDAHVGAGRLPVCLPGISHQSHQMATQSICFDLFHQFCNNSTRILVISRPPLISSLFYGHLYMQEDKQPEDNIGMEKFFKKTPLTVSNHLRLKRINSSFQNNGFPGTFNFLDATLIPYHQIPPLGCSICQ